MRSTFLLTICDRDGCLEWCRETIGNHSFLSVVVSVTHRCAADWASRRASAAAEGMWQMLAGCAEGTGRAAQDATGWQTAARSWTYVEYVTEAGSHRGRAIAAETWWTNAGYVQKFE